MVEKRYEYKMDTMNDCITVYDEREQLTTGFGSELVLYPSEDASTVIDELNRQNAVVGMLIEQLEHYEDIEDIMYWIQETIEEIDNG